MLEKRVQELEQFASIASHDLQEPMRMVSSYLRLLQEDFATGLPAEAQEYVRYASEGAQRMQEMIKALLSFSRMGRATLHRESVALEDVALQATRDLSALIAESDATIEIEDLGNAVVDPILIGNLLRNVLANALKFRAKGRPLHVHVRSVPTSADSVCVAIEDNAIGFEPEFNDEIFQIFRRLHLESEYSGHGIGLAISRRIAEAHGGTLTASGDKGVGAVFTLTLPRAPSDLSNP